MNEAIDSIFVGVVASLAMVYLGIRVHQDRERLKRIVGIIDADHQSDVAYLLQLVDSGAFEHHKLAPITVSDRK